MRLSRIIPFIVFLTPFTAFASTTTDIITQLAGLFYIIVGLALVTSILLMLGGGVLWMVRLGTDHTYRDFAIQLMEWSVATLFTLVVVLGIVEFIQWHTDVVLYIISLAIIPLLIWLIATSGVLSSGEKKEEKK